MPPLLTMTGVSRRYAAGAPEVLSGLDLTVAAGEAVAVVGPSGSGKSTLLNLAGALDRPDAGSVQFEGRDVGALEDDEQAIFRNRTIGFVFQEHHLLPACSALENVLVPALAPGAPLTAEAAEARGRELLARVGLGGKEGRRPAELSGGERQRVAAARALIHRPRLVLADEPTGSLDAAAAAQLVELLLELRRAEGTALLVVTHAAPLAQRLDRVLELFEGRLRA